MKVTLIPTVISALGTVPKRLLQKLVDLEKIGQVETNPDNNIKIGHYNEKSSGELRRLAVTQTIVRSPQLTLL